MKKSVLIIEDDVWLAEHFARILKKEYRTKIAPHALAAINDIDDFKPAAIILDVLLTGSTAFTLLHELQSYSDTGNIPVILCSNLADDLNFDDLKHYGVKRVLNKATMTPSDLVAAIKSVLL